MTIAPQRSVEQVTTRQLIGRMIRPNSRSRASIRNGSPVLGAAFTAPVWLLVLGVALVPIIVAFYTSLTSESLTNPVSGFVGLQNYHNYVFTGSFVHLLIVTLTFVAAGLVVQLPIGYVLAACLHREPRGHRVIRTILIIPMLLTPVALGEAWVMIFDPNLGLAKYLATPFITNPNWLGSPTLAIGVIIFVDAWINIPLVMVLVLAGMSSLPQEPFEAARIDGANWWTTTRYVMLPMLRPVLTVAMLVRVIADFQLFDLIYVLTAGGPGTTTTNLAFNVYQTIFQFYDTGAGAALAVAMAVIALPMFFGFIRLTHV
jgi:multiple sugar transport system permease protein